MRNTSIKVIFILLNVIYFNGAGDAKIRKFPKGFLFGVATSAHQIEGAWNVSGKGENVWDYFTHKNPSVVYDFTNADDAVKSYYYYKRDVEALKDLGVDYYRFSISWSRIFPTGLTDTINQDGVRYYNNLINALVENNISPVATLFHWDHPQALEKNGGWLDPKMAEYFTDYARFCFKTFGDRVKTWVTLNEPREVCLYGYAGGSLAPGSNLLGSEYNCSHTMLRAHGMAYRVYDNEFRQTQKGRVGLTVTTYFFEPSTDDENGWKAVNIRNEFEIGWYANPIFGENGDYPQLMKDMVADKSKEIGLPSSRLPEFTPEDLKMLKGAADFFGINHYTTNVVALGGPEKDYPDYTNDHGTQDWQHWWWTPSAAKWVKNTPWGFRKVLKYLKKTYNNPEIVVLENGWPMSSKRLDDNDRVDYLQGYMNSMLDAIEFDNVNVTAYTVWSLMDCFEWHNGNSGPLGLYSTDFNDPKRPITPKDSAKFYKEVVKTRKIKESKRKIESNSFSLRTLVSPFVIEKLLYHFRHVFGGLSVFD